MAADETSHEDGTGVSPPAAPAIPSQHEPEDSAEQRGSQQRPQQSEPGPVAQDANTAPQDQGSQDSRSGLAAGKQADPRSDGPGQGAASEVGTDSEPGSLPAPAEFAGYEQVLQGAAERILKMAEDANAIQNESLESAAKAEVQIAKRGQYIALALTLLSFGWSVYFFINENALAGVIFITIPLVMLAKSSSREPPVDD
jgi:uncharacterized membrane protein